jgi:hypothetical protein
MMIGMTADRQKEIGDAQGGGGAPPILVYDLRPGRRRGACRISFDPVSGPVSNATASGRRRMPPPCLRVSGEEERKP